MCKEAREVVGKSRVGRGNLSHHPSNTQHPLSKQPPATPSLRGAVALPQGGGMGQAQTRNPPHLKSCKKLAGGLEIFLRQKTQQPSHTPVFRKVRNAKIPPHPYLQKKQSALGRATTCTIASLQMMCRHPKGIGKTPKSALKSCGAKICGPPWSA